MKMRALIPLVLLAACGSDADDSFTQEQLRSSIAEAGVSSLGDLPLRDDALYTVGQALFFDPDLSGNRDIACATCHAPSLATSDFISLAIGTGGSGIGPNRVLTEGRRLVPRNTPDLFNRGYAAFGELNWDGAIRARGDGGYTVPEDWDAIEGPDGYTSVLAAQSLSMLSDRDIMQGRRGDLDLDGNSNEFGGWDDDELPILWDAIVARVSTDAWAPLWEAAGYSVAELSIADVGNAMAEFQAQAFQSDESPFDAFLAGDSEALDAEQQRGAWLFFGDAACARCHSGPHLTDQDFHNIGAPQVGLGQEDEEPLDYGRGRQTGDTFDRFHFRTPPLRNTELTGPWMHDGAYTSLRGAVAHHVDCSDSLRNYDPRQLKPELQHTFRDEPIQLQRILSTLDEGCAAPISASDIDAIVAFLESLTDPAANSLSHVVPESVPSGRAPR
ncbi:MAG: cytochrome c peroxidase [Bradymonadia bacterium]|jgi:cytochrome c peroxidase